MSVFDWGLYPEAENHLRWLVESALQRSRTVRELASEIEKGTSTDFFEWVDHLVLPKGKLDMKRLLELHFGESVRDGFRVFSLQGSTLFPLVEGREEEVVLGPESLSEFCSVHFPSAEIKNKSESAYQKIRLIQEGGLILSALERRGCGGFSAPGSDDVDAYRRALEVFGTRNRAFDTADEGFRYLGGLIEDAAKGLTSARCLDAFFRAEREYWQSKNEAARVQKARQDSQGLGWGNVDHHTFRSSRANFADLVQIFERLGMKPRERYHAGAQAGWGAQILEHLESGEVVFADVDLGAEEKEADFSRQPLAERDQLGTVGLWVELHGESIFQAGLHHLAARFRFEDVTSDLKAEGVGMMKPFSNFPFLRQAFTMGEKWTPSRERLEGLAARGSIDNAQKDKFLSDGAIGSHLENTQRRQGFKGFNQDSVSVIIKATDPRKNAIKGA